jgi:hypothetical protein
MMYERQASPVELVGGFRDRIIEVGTRSAGEAVERTYPAPAGNRNVADRGLVFDNQYTLTELHDDSSSGSRPKLPSLRSIDHLLGRRHRGSPVSLMPGANEDRLVALT